MYLGKLTCTGSGRGVYRRRVKLWSQADLSSKANLEVHESWHFRYIIGQKQNANRVVLLPASNHFLASQGSRFRHVSPFLPLQHHVPSASSLTPGSEHVPPPFGFSNRPYSLSCLRAFSHPVLFYFIEMHHPPYLSPVSTGEHLYHISGNLHLDLFHNFALPTLLFIHVRQQYGTSEGLISCLGSYC